MMLKHFFLFLFILFSEIGFAQALPSDEIKIYDVTVLEIKNITTNSGHKLYWGDLISRFISNPDSLNEYEMTLLVYGFPFSKGYSPMRYLGYETKMVTLNDDRKYSEAKKQGDTLLTKNPISIIGLEELAFTYSRLHDTLKATSYNNRYEKLLAVLENSGDGNSPETAFVVTGLKDIYVLTQIKHMLMLGSKEVEKKNINYTIVKVFHKGKKKKVWFNTTLIKENGIKY